MVNNQAISQPFGVSTYGSAIIRVEPDFAALNFSVRQLSDQPTEAYRQSEAIAQKVKEYLIGTKVVEMSSSHTSLDESYRYEGTKHIFEGYKAAIQFRTFIRDLRRLQEITIGIVDNGVNQLDAPSFQSTRLRELRVDVRRQAIEVARNKAQLFCDTAGVKLGKVIHIEDTNPDLLRGVHSGHMHRDPNMFGSDDEESFSLGSLPISAAVWMSFDLQAS